MFSQCVHLSVNYASIDTPPNVYSRREFLRTRFSFRAIERIDRACAFDRAGTRRSVPSQRIAGRPVLSAGLSVCRSAGLLGRSPLAVSVGPRRGGLNGRRNAVKPFCHSRRGVHRVTGDIQRRITRARSPRGIRLSRSLDLNNFIEYISQQGNFGEV